MTFFDSFIAVLVIVGVFLGMYMAWRQQGILDTVNEIKEVFEDRVDEIATAGGVYR